jgi:hypothetical protein
VQTSVQYFDGLGRPLQTVQAMASPSGRDVVQPFGYDSEGRDSVKYLPYTATTSTPGAYQPYAIAGSNGTYTGILVSSSLLQSGFPGGKTWADF